MRWKKNAFSYLSWVIYAVAVEVGMVCLADAICDARGVEIYFGTIACVIYMILAGIGVFLIHRCLDRRSAAQPWRLTTVYVVEAALTVMLLAAGLVLRIRAISTATESAAYYELASVTSGQEIPQIVHGAVYFYVQLLHGLFYFLGNKFIVAIWTQILLQFAAVLLLYFAVRRLAGNIAAVIMFAFCMLSPYMIKGAVDLSPEMLYLVLWSGVLLWISFENNRQWKLWEFAPIGAVIAVAGYLDAAGLFLLGFAAAVIFACEDEKVRIGRRMSAMLVCLAGTGVGFVAVAAADALASGKRLGGVVQAWLKLYQPLSFRLPISLETSVSGVAGYLILLCVLSLGIYAFWRNRRTDALKAWILIPALMALAACFHVFTVEMPVYRYLYLLLTVLAGVAVEECLVPCRVPEPVKREFAEIINLDEPSAELPSAELPPEEKMETEKAETEKTETEKPRFIENPLPLPKKHQKRMLSYRVEVGEGKDDFDISVDEDDDFDF